MTDQIQKLELDALAAILREKRIAYESIGAMNVNGLGELDAMRLSMRYAQAQAEYFNARDALAAAIAKADAKTPPE